VDRLSPDYKAMLDSQNLVLEKLCSPSCLRFDYHSLEELKSADNSSSGLFHWLNDPFFIRFESAIASFKKKSAPGSN